MVVREQLLRHHLGIVMDGKEGPEERDWEGEKWKEIQEWVLEDIEILREEVSDTWTGQDLDFPSLVIVNPPPLPNTHTFPPGR